MERELRYWCAHRDTDHILLVLTDPEPSGDSPPDIAWDEQRNDFDWSVTTVVPRCLSGVFTSEPRWIRLARTVRTLSPRDPVFQNSVAEVAAPLHSLAKDEMIGEDVRQHRRRSIISRVVGAALLLTTLVAVWQLFVARAAEREAQRQQKAATVRALVLEANAQRDTQLRLSLMLNIAALRLDPMSADGRASLLATFTGNPLTATLNGHRDSVRGVAWSRDGTRLATGSHDHTVSVWDMRNPAHPVRQATLTGHTKGRYLNYSLS